MSPSSQKSGRRKRELKPAPGNLRVVQAFLNTVNLRTGADIWTSPEALARWALAERLSPAVEMLTKDDLERAIKIREGLRSALSQGKSAHSGPLEEALAPTLLRARFEAGALHLEPVASGLDGILGKLLAIIAEAQHDNRWHRFKLCASVECRTAFYDGSSTLTAKWCRPSCGDRTCTRARRRRQLHSGRRGIRSPRFALS